MNGESSLSATIYPIEGLEGEKYRFRILRPRERTPNDTRRPIRLASWATSLWRKHLKQPVFVGDSGPAPYFIAPDSDSVQPGAVYELRDVPDLTYHVEVTDEVREVTPTLARPEERELVTKMIERAFSDRFTNLGNQFWRFEWTQYFRSQPDNARSSRDVVNAFRGLKFSVLFLGGKDPYFAADCRTKYIGRTPLSECDQEDLEGPLREHVNTDIPWDRRPTFVRDNGSRKISCRFAGHSSQTIENAVFGDPKESVLDYYRRVHPSIPIRPSDPAVWAQDRADTPPILCPSSRLFPVFTTEFHGVKRCSTRSQMTPSDRVLSISSFIKDLGMVRYSDRALRVRDQIYAGKRDVFLPPRLLFGGDFVLSIPEDETRGDALEDSVSGWGSRKMPALYEHGPFHFEPLPDPILLYPGSMSRQTREELIHSLSAELQRQTGHTFTVHAQRSYLTGPGQQGGNSVLQEATKIVAEGGRHLVVVVLWDRFQDRVHGDLKEILRAVPSQCVTEGVAVDIATRGTSRWPSRLRNLALAIATEVGGQPWVIAENLRADLYVGIDVLFGRVGYNFLYGPGGRKVFREVGWATQGGRAKEAIKRVELSQRLMVGLRKAASASGPIGSLVIHRDGRWWPSEALGLRHAVSQARREGLLKEPFSYAVVEIRKHHAPLRLMTRSTAAGNPSYRNPLPGSFLPLDSKRMILSSTGRPGLWDSALGRTAGTLLLNVAEEGGSTDLMAIGEDAYRLTHLNWSAPDIELSLPVTIRWADEALRETLLPPDDDERGEAGDETEESAEVTEEVEVGEE